MSLRLLAHAPRSTYPESRVIHGMKGGSVWGKIKGFFGKANKWLRKTGLISKVAGVAGMVDPRFRAASGVASALGYGRRFRRHRRRGGAIKLAGMGLGLAGGRRRHRRIGMTNLPMAY